MSSSSSLISELKTLVEEGGNEKNVEAYEDVVVEEIEEYVKEESFYELPTNEILKIVGKSDFGDIDILCEVISRMSESKGEESTLLLNVIKREDATLEECIKILSKFEHSQICQRTNYAYNEDKKQPERDFEHELEELKKGDGKHKKETEVKKIFFPPVTEEPPDFENSILKAAKEGKLTSVQYIVEKYHANVETKGFQRRTPLFWASLNCHLEVVQYLCEKCHANVETRDVYFGNTPLINASLKGHLEMVKYLYEACHADVEAQNNKGQTPIIIASENGCFQVVKYLCETCHAKITEQAIKEAKTKEIREYLISKK